MFLLVLVPFFFDPYLCVTGITPRNKIPGAHKFVGDSDSYHILVLT